MKSWSDWFEHRADERRRESKAPCGFRTTERYVLEDTPENRAWYIKALSGPGAR